MKTTYLVDATLRKLTRFVDLWKEDEELAGSADDKKWTQLKGWVTLSELRSMPRSAILDAIGYELSKGTKRDVVSVSLVRAAFKTRIDLLPRGLLLVEIVSQLR